MLAAESVLSGGTLRAAVRLYNWLASPPKQGFEVYKPAYLSDGREVLHLQLQFFQIQLALDDA
jgi:hypothetical protein